MRVRALSNTDDWTFGKGKANYIGGSDALAQTVKARLRSFRDDWFLNVNAGVPWVELLGNPGTERRLLRAVERTVLQTEGVLRVTQLDIVRRDGNRGITLELSYVDVYEAERRLTLEQAV